jgi:hypothetical protein
MVVSLSQQARELIDQAPADLQQSIAKIAPLLQQIAGNLAHQSYFIGQNHNQEWVSIVLENRQRVQKHSVYAFSRQQDARQFYDADDRAVEMPVIDLLFQLIALESIDQLIFFDQPGNWESGRTVSRTDIQEAIAQHLQTDNNLPPNVC